MNDLESKIKKRRNKLDGILLEYEKLNSESRYKYVNNERELELELILLEELLNNIDSSDKWIKRLEKDREDAKSI